jgi:chromosome segregation ATPase
MGGKKKAAKKEKGGDDDGDNPAEMNAMLEAAVDGLK